MAGRGMLIALQLGLLLLALLLPQQVYSAPADTTVPMAPQVAATTPRATTAKTTASGSISIQQSTVSVLVVSLSSLLLCLHF